MAALFSFIHSWLGFFFGIILAFFGSIVQDNENPLELRSERKCCAELSLSGLEEFDARSPASILASMRSTNSDDHELAHNGFRLSPNNFQGIWWMDGNPAPEVLVTTADAFFLTPNDDPDNIPNLYVPTLDFEGGTWSYNDSILGRALFVNQCVNDVRPKFTLDSTLTRLLYQGDRNNEENEMEYIDDDTYQKPILRDLKTYTLRRIIDAEGQETANWPVWIDFVNAKRSRRSLLTYRRRGRDESCHTDLI